MALLSYALTTVANVKTRLGISVSTYDTVLETLVNNATDWIESQLGGRRVKQTTYTQETYDGGGCDIFLRQYPGADLTACEYNAGDYATAVWTAFQTSQYTLVTDGGYVHFTAPTPKGVRNLRFTYKGGYATIPSDLQVLCEELAGREFNRRKADGMLSEAVDGQAISWNTDLTADQKATLAKYKRKL